MTMSAIEVHVLLAVYACGHPQSILTHPESTAAISALERLERINLIEKDEAEDYQATEKGLVFIKEMLSTPLPVSTWIIPKRNAA